MLNLLELVPDLNYKDDDNCTPLFYLCENERVTKELVDLLLSRGAKPEYGLIGICSNYNLDPQLAKYLLSKVSDINFKGKRGRTALNSLADKADNNALKVAKMVFDKCKGKVSHDKDDWNSTPIQNACNSSEARIEFIQLLVDNGGNPTDGLVGSLSSYYLQQALVEKLLKLGANPNGRNKDGESGLHGLFAKVSSSF